MFLFHLLFFISFSFVRVWKDPTFNVQEPPSSNITTLLLRFFVPPSSYPSLFKAASKPKIFAAEVADICRSRSSCVIHAPAHFCALGEPWREEGEECSVLAFHLSILKQAQTESLTYITRIRYNINLISVQQTLFFIQFLERLGLTSNLKKCQLEEYSSTRSQFLSGS